MKRILIIIFCAICTLSITSAQTEKKKNTKETTVFLIKDMHCENCVKKVEKNIAFEKGVTDLKCDLNSKSVEVTYNTEKISEKKLLAAFKKIKMEAIVVSKE